MTAKEYRKECEARRGGITEMEGKLCDELERAEEARRKCMLWAREEQDRAEKAEAALAEREHDIAELTAAVVENEPKLLAMVKAARRVAGPYPNEIPGIDFEVDSVDMGYLREALLPFEGLETNEEKGNVRP
jgi:hypothetical protein